MKSELALGEVGPYWEPVYCNMFLCVHDEEAIGLISLRLALKEIIKLLFNSVFFRHKK